MKKVRWGILGTANIAIQRVISAMQGGKYSVVEAIGSRRRSRAQSVANELDIPRFYGSYDALLNDEDINAVYVPLPNNLHVPWAIKALEAGKHVLCEKPLAMDADDAEHLLEEAGKYPDLKVMEAFMYRFHPQWKKAYELVHNNEIGRLQSIEIFFSYYNTDPVNIRNQRELGGGALMDLGCYALSIARYLFEIEPDEIYGRMKQDSDLGIDYLTSAIMDFGDGIATFNCSTQISPHRHVNICGTEGRIAIPKPLDPSMDSSSKLMLHFNSDMEVLELPAANHYALQVEAFCKAILFDWDVPISLGESYANMQALDDVRRSAVFVEH